MRILRPDLDSALMRFARAGHGVVLGRPGVGKTYSIAELCRSLTSNEVPYLLLAVAEFGSASEEELRTLLGYEGTFAEQLTKVFRSSNDFGLVVFDGYDAARNEEARSRVLQYVRYAVRAAPGMWSVLVTVRSYDAAKSPSLIELFAGGRGRETTDMMFQLPGVSARHFLIPELTQAEAASALEQIPGMIEAYARASEGFRRLVRVPFNLWLVERIVQAAAEPRQVGALQSELQLLELFWRAYVTDSLEADRSLFLLQNMVRIMVEETRLSLTKHEVYQPQFDAAWRALLSSEVLTEAGRVSERISFSHNILFDYAVSVLAMGDDLESITSFLTANPARSLFLRPSLLYLFTHWWYSDRDLFWKSFWDLLDHRLIAIRLVARLIPPVVVATEARSSTDLGVAIDEYRRSPERGGVAILRLLQGLRFVAPPDKRAWIEFVDALAAQPHRTFAWELAVFLDSIVDDKADARQSTMDLVGHAGRALFEWAWEQRGHDSSGWFDSFNSNLVLPIVLRTFSGAPKESALVARRVLSLLNEPDFPIDYFVRLSDKVESLAPLDPDLVANIYKGVFGHVESSDKPTHLGGIVLRLTGTRRQDFSSCHYMLAKAYPAFLRLAPQHAIPVGVDILNQFAIRKHVLPYLKEGYTLKDLAESVRFLGQERTYITDFSVSWGQLAHEEETDIADALVSYLSSEDLTPDPTALVALYADHAAAAVTWVKLLEAGVAAPARYAEFLHELCTSAVVQLGSDTVEILGRFVNVAAALWSVNQRKLFEQSVLALPRKRKKRGRNKDRATAERNRRIADRLLAQVPAALLVTKAARARIQRLTAADALPKNEPLVRLSSWSSPYSDDEWLSDQGADLKLDSNARLFAAAKPLDEFIERWQNKAPDADAVKQILPELRARLAELEQETLNIGAASDSPPAPVVVDHAWTKLAGAAHTVARSDARSGTEEHEVVRRVLLAAAARPPREVPGNANESYDWPHWSPTPRIEAIQGLTHLTWNAADPQASLVLAELAESPDPAERFLAIQYGAKALARTATDLFWTTLTSATQRERNAVVVAALLGSIGYGRSYERAEPIVQSLHGHWNKTKQRQLRTALADWVVHFALRNQSRWALDAIRSYTHSLDAHGEILSDATFRMIMFVTPRKLLTGDDAQVAGRAVTLLQLILEDLESRAKELKALSDAGGQPSTDEWHAILSIVDHLVARIYFNARQDRNDEPNSAEHSSAIGFDELTAYYGAIYPVLTDILRFSEIGVGGTQVGSTAHHFMQFLNSVASVDPAGILDLSARLIATASKGGYQLDSMAIGEVVTLVEVVLADHREVLKTAQSLENMLQLLDVFASVGWPQALRLVWQLDEVFR